MKIHSQLKRNLESIGHDINRTDIFYVGKHSNSPVFEFCVPNIGSGAKIGLPVMYVALPDGLKELPFETVISILQSKSYELRRTRIE